MNAVCASWTTSTAPSTRRRRWDQRGRARSNSNVAFGAHYLLPRLSEFLERFPDIQRDVTLSDVVVDLLDGRSDVAIRTGPLPGSRLTQRGLATSGLVVVASPCYLRRTGIPNGPKTCTSTGAWASTAPGMWMLGPPSPHRPTQIRRGTGP